MFIDLTMGERVEAYLCPIHVTTDTVTFDPKTEGWLCTHCLDLGNEVLVEIIYKEQP